MLNPTRKFRPNYLISIIIVYTVHMCGVCASIVIESPLLVTDCRFGWRHNQMTNLMAHFQYVLFAKNLLTTYGRQNHLYRGASVCTCVCCIFHSCQQLFVLWVEGHCERTVNYPSIYLSCDKHVTGHALVLHDDMILL